MKMYSTLWVGIGVIAPLLLGSAGSAQAQTVMQQCGQQYQAAKAAGTLNGMTWNQFRKDCSAKLKAEPAAATTPAAAPAAPAAPAEPATQTANPLNPAPAATTTAAPASTTGKTPSAGRTAFVARERQCGSEWRANKATLIAQTPGLTWPKYLSSCNARLKAAGK
jgi:hypothetical protein